MAVSENAKAYIPSDWLEPAHVHHIEKFDDLLSIYKYIKEKYQRKIDAAFDRASREIGFVVATSLPITIEIAEGGVVKTTEFAMDNLKETIFDRQVLNEVRALNKDKIAGVRKGMYEIQLVWLEALKLKLRADWVEPAHFRLFDHLFKRPELRPEVKEPVHWKPGTMLDRPDRVLVSIIDEVYPELQLVERLGKVRHGAEAIAARDWVEPAHYGRVREDILERDLLRRRAYADRPRMPRDYVEPAHYRRIPQTDRPAFAEENVLSELASVLRSYGY